MQKIVITINKTINFHIIKVWLYELLAAIRKWIWNLVVAELESAYANIIHSPAMIWLETHLMLKKSTDSEVSLRDSYRGYDVFFVFEQFI